MANPEFLEVNSADARELASVHGEGVACDPRDDGGWDVLVILPHGGEIVVSVTRDADHSLHVFA